ncbi:MAG: serine protease AprX [Paraglaciecola sp.]|jgi:serine protease AprX
MKCPICCKDHGPLIRNFNSSTDLSLVETLTSQNENWQSAAGACTRCVDHAQLDQWRANAGPQDPFTDMNPDEYPILSIPRRLAAHSGYTGKGVTICFIDSGFNLHPDLTQPENRILKVFDVRYPEQGLSWDPTHPHNWHGSMTSVVGTGNGWLSEGYYKSLAPDAKVVLIKVMDENGSISREAITNALQWVQNNHQEYGIQIINLSVSGDSSGPYRESPIGLAIEQLVLKGIHVVAAAGNSAEAQLIEPANCPHALTIGGLDDHNTLHPLTHSLYHSTFGETADRTYKPELIAPAIWLPAPILPGTEQQREAEALFAIQNAPKVYKRAVAAKVIQQTKLPHDVIYSPVKVLEEQVAARIKDCKYISGHYQHSDGTSFAAPIVCSIIAQMLEANPDLTPSDVRDLLFRTARNLEGLPEERQGFGVVHPLSAVYHAEEVHNDLPSVFNPIIDYKAASIRFQLKQGEVSSATAIGAFNEWEQPGMALTSEGISTWELAIPLPAPGTYPYKFLINKDQWQGDTRNLYWSPDGFGGRNSLLIVEDN